MNTFNPCAIARPILRSRRLHPASMLCSLLLVTSIVPAAAQPEPGPELAPSTGVARSTDGPRMEIPALKAAYLDCDRAATERLLSLSEAMTCSQVSEALLSRAFNRDFDQLLAWWRSEKRLRQGETVGSR